MFRKATMAAVLAVVLVSMFTVTAYAAGGTDFQTVVDQANAKIDNEINKAVYEANQAVACRDAKINYTLYLQKRGFISWNEANGRIMNYRADLNNYVRAIGSRLIARTDAIALGVIQEARRYGITVVCTYVEVNLAGQTFLIDPLRIVGN